MLTGDIRTQIDRIWDAFWSGGISNPLEVIEQITYLLFLRRLDDLQTLEQSKAERFRETGGRLVFPEGNDSKGRPYQDYRWSRFKHLSEATPAQRSNWILIGDGHDIHWPDVDEDLSADGMLNGVPARRPETNDV